MVATIVRVDCNSLLLVLSHSRDHEAVVTTMTAILHSFFNSCPNFLILVHCSSISPKGWPTQKDKHLEH